MDPNLILLAHLPFLRMQRQEDFAFGPGCLTKLPWEQYDDITQGAFSDWKPKYVATDPVFFWFQDAVGPPFVEADPEGEAKGFLESKVPRDGWSTLPRLGLPLLLQFQQQMVRPVWAALVLAAPHARIASPLSSVAFQLAAGAHCLDFQGRKHQGVRVQGDADQELVYLAAGAAPPLEDSQLELARQLLPLAVAVLSHPDAESALIKLLATTEVTLDDADRLLLSVTALEELLLPEVTSGMGRVFARRLVHLLASGTTTAEQLEETARNLYRLRSRALHASEHDGDLEAISEAARDAETLLADAILAALPLFTESASADAARAALDRQLASAPLTSSADVEPSPTWSPVARPEAPDETEPRSRLGPRRSWGAGTFSTSASLRPPEGQIVSWSPLVGCRLVGQPFSHDALRFQFGELPLAAVVDMEEKDIRRDFIAQTRLGDSVPVIAVFGEQEGNRVDDDAVRPLTRVRDLAVTGLRLGRASHFVDPELLGWYVYERSMRFRRETVLRQSVLMAARKDAVDVVQTDGEGLADLAENWNLLAQYEASSVDPRIEDCLATFRRAHDRRFLAANTRATLLFSNLESLLGRFRPRKKKVQLEDLVARLPGGAEETTEWFATCGRQFRNHIAHRTWEPPDIPAEEVGAVDQPELDHLLEINRLALLALLREWVRVDAPVRRYHGPSRLLLRSLR